MTINGEILSVAVAETLRVAVECFAISISGDALGTDDHGRAVTQQYKEHIETLRALINQRG